MTSAEAAVVHNQIVVEAPIARAFAVFTERFGDFKPPEHNLLDGNCSGPAGYGLAPTAGIQG